MIEMMRLKRGLQGSNYNKSVHQSSDDDIEMEGGKELDTSSA